MAHAEVYYKDYLQLNKILHAQEPESDRLGIEAHDEMLFIITHQAYELWFKQIIYELDSVIKLLASPRVNDNDPTLQVVVHRVNRINTILRLLVEQINIMETMTSLDFLDFRDLLRPASGFQSVQWKELEAKLGLTFEARHGKEHYTSALRPEDKESVKSVESGTSLLTLLNAWLERMPYFELAEVWPNAQIDSPENHPFWHAYRKAYSNSLLQIEASNVAGFDAILFGKDGSPDRKLSPRACRAALFIMLYRGYPLLHLPFQLLNQVLETDELMATWRMRHMNMVHRMIGSRVGTGNSSGRNYLKAALDKHYIFTEVAELNGLLLERRNLPKLPAQLERQFGFLETQY